MIISPPDSFLIKKAITDNDKYKLKSEHDWYKYMSEHKYKLIFPFPDILEFNCDLDDFFIKFNYNATYYFPLIAVPKNNRLILNEIANNYLTDQENHKIEAALKYLNKLHSVTEVRVNKELFYADLIYEIKTKILETKKHIDPIIQKYSYIKCVNGVPIISYKKIINAIYYIAIAQEADYMPLYTYSIIHGKCHFNNILVNNQNNMLFVNPRGYYGTTRLFGFYKYDIASICFALSGFNALENYPPQKELNIITDNFYIPDQITILSDKIIKQDKMICALVMAMWLALPSNYQDNNKCITSYFIGLYLASIYLFPSSQNKPEES